MNGTQFSSRQRLKKQKLFISWFFRYLFYSFYLLLRVSHCRLFIITRYLQIVIWAIQLNVLYILWAHKQAYLPHVIWIWHIILMNNKISLVTNSLSCYQTGKFPINVICVPLFVTTICLVFTPFCGSAKMKLRSTEVYTIKKAAQIIGEWNVVCNMLGFQPLHYDSILNSNILRVCWELVYKRVFKYNETKCW